jgi:hypothetical protein
MVVGISYRGRRVVVFLAESAQPRAHVAVRLPSFVFMICYYPAPHRETSCKSFSLHSIRSGVDWHESYAHCNPSLMDASDRIQDALLCFCTSFKIPERFGPRNAAVVARSQTCAPPSDGNETPSRSYPSRESEKYWIAPHGNNMRTAYFCPEKDMREHHWTSQRRIERQVGSY